MPDNIFADIGKFGAGALQTAGNIGIASLREIGAPGWHERQRRQDWMEQQSVYDRDIQEWTAIKTLVENTKPDARNTPEYNLLVQSMLSSPVTKTLAEKIKNGEELGQPFSKDIFDFGDKSYGDLSKQVKAWYDIYDLTGDETALLLKVPKEKGESAEEYKIRFENDPTVIMTRQMNKLAGSQLDLLNGTPSVSPPETMAGSMSKPKAEKKPGILSNIGKAVSYAQENKSTTQFPGTSSETMRTAPVEDISQGEEPPVEKQKPADVAPRPEFKAIWPKLSSEQRKKVTLALQNGYSPDEIIASLESEGTK